mmetsp:Transcript_10851/g.14557  ORF Transcript_10851/g.14557 Transcript_10851/m.14557 type:complete len:224 (-) Transcript_10851:1372-2043(-)
MDGVDVEGDNSPFKPSSLTTLKFTLSLFIMSSSSSTSPTTSSMSSSARVDTVAAAAVLCVLESLLDTVNVVAVPGVAVVEDILSLVVGTLLRILAINEFSTFLPIFLQLILLAALLDVALEDSLLAEGDMAAEKDPFICLIISSVFLIDVGAASVVSSTASKSSDCFRFSTNPFTEVLNLEKPFNTSELPLVTVFATAATAAALSCTIFAALLMEDCKCIDAM